MMVVFQGFPTVFYVLSLFFHAGFAEDGCFLNLDTPFRDMFFDYFCLGFWKAIQVKVFYNDC